MPSAISLPFHRFAIAFSALVFSLACSAPAPAAGAGAISGTVVFEGQAPPMRVITMETEPVCETHHKDSPAMTEWLVLGEGQKMANVLVRVVGGLPQQAWPANDTPTTLTQSGCVYSPHVLAVRVNQPIQILNPDGILHNLHFLPKINAELNKSMSKERRETSHTFKKAEDPFPIKCDVHSWMNSWVAVLDHPFFDVTAKDGKYEIKDLPAGKYTIEAWQERLGTQKVEIEIGAEGAVTRNFVFKRPEAAGTP